MTCEQLKQDARSVYLSKEAIDILIEQAREKGYDAAIDAFYNARHSDFMQDAARWLEMKKDEVLAALRGTTAPAEGQDKEGEG